MYLSDSLLPSPIVYTDSNTCYYKQLMKSLRSDKANKHSRYFLRIQLLSIINRQNSAQPIIIKLYKGIQKLDEIKEPVDSGTGSVDNEGTLDFYATLEENQRTVSYRVVVEGVDGSKIGESNLDVSPIINDFLKKGCSPTTKILGINENMEIQTRVFVEKSKEELAKSVCSFSETHSVYRTRTEHNLSMKDAKDKSKDSYLLSEKNRNSNTRESNESPQYKDHEEQEQSQLLTSEIMEHKEPLRNNEKVEWNDEEFQSISVVNSKQLGDKGIGHFSAKTIVTFVILFLCVLGFLITKIEDQKGELSRIIKVTRRVLEEKSL